MSVLQRLFPRRSRQTKPAASHVADYRTLARPASTPRRGSLRTSDKIEAMLDLSQAQVQSGRFRTQLYRFLTDNLPLVSACIWTWSRLAAAPGEYRMIGESDRARSRGAAELNKLACRLTTSVAGRPVSQTTFLVDLFQCLFRDGQYGGFVTVAADGSRVDRFVPLDVADVRIDEDSARPRMVCDAGEKQIPLDRPDFFHLGLNQGQTSPLGRSILQAIPFVAYIEQQLVDDMRRSSHNAGFHRLHVKITPPEKLAGEGDGAYVDRINSYFDSTVRMIRSCEVDDNPVTWDNVTIESIGPRGAQTVTNRWFMNHRSLVEEICAGTHLAPFLLGYSYGATTTWAGFKFDLVMRQVQSVQAEAAQLLKQIGDVELALRGIDGECEFVFDNCLAYQAGDAAAVQAQQLDTILKLHQAGLLDKQAATDRVGALL